MLHYVKMFACMFGGHVRFDCNGILIELSRLPMESRVEMGAAFKLMK